MSDLIEKLEAATRVMTSGARHTPTLLAMTATAQEGYRPTSSVDAAATDRACANNPGEIQSPRQSPVSGGSRGHDGAAHHSVGPWKLCAHLRTPPVDCPCGYAGGIWSGDGEALICEMGAHGDDSKMVPVPDDETQRANARLIASAPALLAANRALRAFVHRVGYEPVGAAYSTHEDVLNKLEAEARALLAALDKEQT